MNCSEFEASLDRYLDESLPEPERERCDAHLLACAGCTGVLAALSGGVEGAPDLIPFLKAHRLADGLLPEFAQLDPGVEFAEELLRRTRHRARARRARHAIADWWVRQLERPQFAGEFAYALTVLMALAVFVPASPLAGWSRAALDGLRPGEVEEKGWLEANLLPIAAAPARWVDVGERAGGEVAVELESRADALGVVLGLGSAHAREIADALWERDWEALRPLLTRMRCDLQLMWEATRGALSSDEDEAFRC